MTLDSTRDLLYLVLAIAVGWVAVFLCWALYELGKLLNQTNRMVAETEQKILRIERGVMAVKDRLESSVSYLGILAEGGKAVMSMIKNRMQDAGEEDEEEDASPKKKRKSKLFEDVGMN
jgi:hypothetical protein